MKNIKNIVFSGGSVKGISHCGAIMALEELEISSKVKRIAGCSIGSVVATFFALGFNSDKMFKIIKCTNFQNLKTTHEESLSKFSTIFNGTGNIISKYGIYNNNGRKEWLRKLLIDNGISENITFQQIFENYKKELIIVGTNLNTNSLTYFSPKSTGNMTVLDAMLISTCIPLIFEPITFNNEQYVDGGVMCNYPIEVFRHIDPNLKQTIGFLTSTSKTNNQIKDIYSFLDSLISTVYLAINDILNDSSIQNRTIFVCKNIKQNRSSIINFEITESEKEEMLVSGYNATLDYFKKNN